MLSDPDIREGIKKYSQWPTIPQVGLLSLTFTRWSHLGRGTSMHDGRAIPPPFFKDNAL